jgi:hypothetical protein
MWKGLFVMKKILSLGILVAALAVIAGCDDKKTTASPVVKTGGTGTATAGTGTH